MTEERREQFPKEREHEHIAVLAQKIIEVIAPYARDHKLTIPGVMSALGTAVGAILARAYSDPALAQVVAARLSIAATEYVAFVHGRDAHETRH